MIVVRPPQPGDLEIIGCDAAEQWVRDRFRTGADFSAVINRPYTNVALIDGVPVAAGGFIDRGENKAFAWSLVSSKVASQRFVTLCRAFRRHIAAVPFFWIEAHCIETFHQSHRWVRILGFQPMPGTFWMPDGQAFRKFVFRNDCNGT